MSIYLYLSHAKGLHPAMSQISQLYSGTRGTVVPERDCSEDTQGNLGARSLAAELARPQAVLSKGTCKGGQRNKTA